MAKKIDNRQVEHILTLLDKGEYITILLDHPKILEDTRIHKYIPVHTSTKEEKQYNSHSEMDNEYSDSDE